MTVNTAYLGTPSGSTTVLSDLSVSGTAYLGNMTLVGDLALDGASSDLSIDGTLAVGSTTSLRGAIAAFGGAVIIGDVAIDGATSDLSVDGTLAVGSTTSLRGATTTYAGVSMIGSSNLSVGGTLAVGSTSSLRGATTLHGALDSASNISGARLTGSGLSVTGIAGVTSNVSIDGSIIKLAGLASSSLLTVTSANIGSFVTNASAVGMTANQLRFVFTASGLSLIYCSGTSIYDIGSNSSAATPT